MIGAEEEQRHNRYWKDIRDTCRVMGMQCMKILVSGRDNIGGMFGSCQKEVP
jgi:hypothetical protein